MVGRFNRFARFWIGSLSDESVWAVNSVCITFGVSCVFGQVNPLVASV